MKNNTGFIALTFVIIAAALILVIGTTIAITSMEEVERARGAEKSNYALALANSCAEIGVLRLLEDWNYEGRERVAVGDSFCNILAVEKLVSPAHPYYGRRLRAWATVNGYRREVEVEIRDVRDGLVSWWKFDEEGGCIAIDSSESRINVGELMSICPTNSPTWGLDRHNRVNRALNFDGVDDYVEVPYNVNLNSDVFTVSVWAKVKGGQGSWRSPITSRDGTPRSGYILYAGLNDFWQFWIGDGTAWRALTGNPVILNEWIYLTAVYNGSEMIFYNDGVRVAGPTAWPLLKNTQRPTRIGAGATETNPRYLFNGLIDEVRIYNRALTSAEITTRHRAGIYLREIY